MRALLVAYYYPPINSGGTERSAKIVKYLPRLGHEVSVLTGSDGPDSAGVREFRVHDASHNCHRVGTHGIQWFLLRCISGGLNELGVYHSIYSFWRNRVLRAADRIAELCRPQVILATYPPIENLEIALGLSDRFGVPLVSDFRDGLLFEPVERDRLARYRCVRRHYRRVERAVAERSATVVTAFPSVTEYFGTEYGLERVVTMTNGYDEEDFAELAPSRLMDARRFNIVHAGRFGGSYSGRDIASLCEALRGLKAAEPELAQRMCLHQFGPLERSERALLADLIDGGVVVAHGLQPRASTLACQVEADALLLLTASDRPGNAPGKLFEYLRAGPLIIGLTCRSYSERVIRETGTGWTVDPGDAGAIKTMLREVATGSPALAVPTRNTEKIQEYARERQVARLAAVVDDIGKSPPVGTMKP